MSTAIANKTRLGNRSCLVKYLWEQIVSVTFTNTVYSRKERIIYELKYYRDEWPLKCLFLIAIQSFLHWMICTQIAGIDPQYKHLSAISGLSEMGLDSVQSLNIQNATHDALSKHWCITCRGQPNAMLTIKVYSCSIKLIGFENKQKFDWPYNEYSSVLIGKHET